MRKSGIWAAWVLTLLERLRGERLVIGIKYRQAMSAKTDDLRHDLLTQALQLTEVSRSRLADLGSDDLAALRERAGIESHMAILLHKLSRTEDAEPHFLAGIAMLNQIPKLPATGAAFDEDLVELLRVRAQILNTYGLSLRIRGHAKAAFAIHQQARETRAAIVTTYPWLLSARAELAQSLGNLADTSVSLDDTTTEFEFRQAATDLLWQISRDSPSASGVLDFWALHKVRWAVTLHRIRDDTASKRHFRETFAAEPHPENAEPTNPYYLLDVAFGHCLLSDDTPVGREHLDSARRLILRSAELKFKLTPDTDLSRFLDEPTFERLYHEKEVQEMRDRAESNSSKGEATR